MTDLRCIHGRRAMRLISILLAALLMHGSNASVAAPATAKSGGLLASRLSRGCLKDFNVLLVTFDTVRADHIGCYGYEKAATPTLDGLARRGVQFDHAISSNPSTLPSHTTIMSGLEVPRHGARTNAFFTVEDRVETMAEVFSKRGYATSAFVGTFVLNHKFGLHQGFDHYSDKLPKGGRKANHVTDSAIAWLKETRSIDPDRRFFMWAHYFDAHLPYTPPREFLERFREQPYDGEIAFADRELGRLLGFLDAEGLTERTLIVMTADHGEGLFEHEEKDHSRLVYDTTMRVPLIISCPPFFDGPMKIADRVVGTVDVMPTVLSLLGIDDGPAMDGIDLVTQSVPLDRAIYIETLAPLLYHGWASLHGLRRLDAKYISAPLPEYFDLSRDPNELDNLYERDPSIIKELRAQLANRIAAWPKLDELGVDIKGRNAQYADRLASLGYVTTGSPGDVPPSERADPKDMVPIFVAITSETPSQLNDRSLDLARASGGDRGSYRRAVILAEVAHKQDPDNLEFAATFGLALFRAGRLNKALETLSGVRRVRKARQLGEDPLAEIVLTMALHGLGRAKEAKAAFERIDASSQTENGVWASLAAEAGELFHQTGSGAAGGG